jgi:hypothetical protein
MFSSFVISRPAAPASVPQWAWWTSAAVHDEPRARSVSDRHRRRRRAIPRGGQRGGTSFDAVDGSGQVHIASHDLTNNRIRYSTNASGSWVSSTIDSSPAGAKPRSSLILQGVVSLLSWLPDGNRSSNRLGSRLGQPWVLRDGRTHSRFDHATTFSLTIDSQGTRHIALVTDLPELIHYWDPGFPPSTAAGSLFERIPLPSGTSFRTSPAIAAAGGALHVLFRDASTKSLHHSTNGSGEVDHESVDQASGMEVGSFCDAAVHGATGRLHVAYYDATNRDLRLRAEGSGQRLGPQGSRRGRRRRLPRFHRARLPCGRSTSPTATRPTAAEDRDADALRASSPCGTPCG